MSVKLCADLHATQTLVQQRGRVRQKRDARGCAAVGHGVMVGGEVRAVSVADVVRDAAMRTSAPSWRYAGLRHPLWEPGDAAVAGHAQARDRRTMTRGMRAARA